MSPIEKLIRYIKNFFAITAANLPSLGIYVKMGFKAYSNFTEFYLEKYVGESYRIRFYQQIDPFNPKYRPLINFEIEEACLVIESLQTDTKRAKKLAAIRPLFDYCYERPPYIFFFDREMDFHGRNLPETLQKVGEILQE